MIEGVGDVGIQRGFVDPRRRQILVDVNPRWVKASVGFGIV